MSHTDRDSGGVPQAGAADARKSTPAQSPQKADPSAHHEEKQPLVKPSKPLMTFGAPDTPSPAGQGGTAATEPTKVPAKKNSKPLMTFGASDAPSPTNQGGAAAIEPSKVPAKKNPKALMTFGAPDTPDAPQSGVAPPKKPKQPDASSTAPAPAKSQLKGSEATQSAPDISDLLPSKLKKPPFWSSMRLRSKGAGYPLVPSPIRTLGGVDAEDQKTIDTKLWRETLSPTDNYTLGAEPEVVPGQSSKLAWTDVVSGLVDRVAFWKSRPDDDDEDSGWNSFGRPFRAVCTNPKCKCRIETPPEDSDKMLKCPLCQNSFYVPTIFIECPNEQCQSAGLVTVDRINSQLTCDDCGTEFYFEQGGRDLVIGKFTGKYVDPFYIAPPPKYKPNFIEKAEKRWRKLDAKIRLRVKYGIYAAIGFLALFAIWNKFLKPGPDIPTTIDGRVTYVAKAILNSEFEKINYLLDSKSSGKDVDQWILKVRPSDWPEKPKGWKVASASGAKNSKVASYRVTFIGPAVAAPASQVPPPEVAETPVEITEQDVEEDQEVEEIAEEEANESTDAFDTPADANPAAQLVTEAPKAEGPKHSISINFKNYGEDGGGWRLDMKTNLRSVGLGEPE